MPNRVSIGSRLGGRSDHEPEPHSHDHGQKRNRNVGLAGLRVSGRKFENRIVMLNNTAKGMELQAQGH